MDRDCFSKCTVILLNFEFFEKSLNDFVTYFTVFPSCLRVFSKSSTNDLMDVPLELWKNEAYGGHTIYNVLVVFQISASTICLSTIFQNQLNYTLNIVICNAIQTLPLLLIFGFGILPCVNPSSKKKKTFSISFCESFCMLKKNVNTSKEM